MIASTPTTQSSPPDISTAEAFYRLFCALSKQDRLAAAWYILHDEEVREQLEQAEFPNDVTLNAFAEDKTNMPAFETIQELGQDLLA